MVVFPWEISAVIGLPNPGLLLGPYWVRVPYIGSRRKHRRLAICLASLHRILSGNNSVSFSQEKDNGRGRSFWVWKLLRNTLLRSRFRILGVM
jgi:hypothetical protein